nr:uncharacterized protein LOC111506724 [Leptinotarsa decemlineata]
MKKTTTTKSDRQPPTPFKMSHLTLLALMVLSCLLQPSLAVCPILCECKWKSGKESVVCVNATLTVIPLQLDPSTQVLDLTGNNIVSIRHEEFSKAGLVNLQKVYITRCRLKTLERYSFKYLINLVELDLSYNALSNVPSHTFESVTELRELKLNGNPIQKVFNDAFMHIPQLIRLEISDCKISLIEPRAFSGLEKSLEWLRLDNNKLFEVAARSFTKLQSLHGLELAGNPWNCSCSLRPLREWMLRQNVPFGVPPMCYSPKRLHMKSWDKLELDEYACVPEIFAYDSKAHGIEGKNVTMTCKIAGVPEPNVRWMLKNKVIANLSGSSIAGAKKLYIVHLTNSSSDLTIFSADLQDAGTYICAAENKAGKAEASVTLAVSKKPLETGFSNKALIASVITGIAFVLISCLISLCICSVRKKQVLKWRTRECRREDNYEKIEMNHKVVVKVNGGVSASQELPVVVERRNGEYRVVPGGELDQEGEEEEESNVDASSSGRKGWSGEVKGGEKGWNSPEHLLDPEDLHIPRRTIQETRDNIKKPPSSTCGTYKQFSPSSSSVSISPSTPLHGAPVRRYVPPTAASFANKELSRVTEDAEKQFPDLLESSPKNRFLENKFYCVGLKAASEGGSVSDINEIFCTLPRKKDLAHSSRYRSCDSQSPLLPDSRYGSSGGESYLGSQDNGHRRMSDFQKSPFPTNLNRNRVNRISNSYLNLTREDSLSSPREIPTELNATPLLDVTGLESRILFNKREMTSSPATSTASNTTSYDYHAAQLERFLEEYRTLQKQLTKMKETCDNLCQEKEKEQKPIISPTTPSSSSLNNSANLAVSPNSTQSLEDSVDFRNFESELTKYLISKKLSPNTFDST